MRGFKGELSNPACRHLVIIVLGILVQSLFKQDDLFSVRSELGGRSIIDVPLCGQEVLNSGDPLVVHHSHCPLTEVQDTKDMLPFLS